MGFSGLGSFHRHLFSPQALAARRRQGFIWCVLVRPSCSVSLAPRGYEAVGTQRCRSENQSLHPAACTSPAGGHGLEEHGQLLPPPQEPPALRGVGAAARARHRPSGRLRRRGTAPGWALLLLESNSPAGSGNPAPRRCFLSGSPVQQQRKHEGGHNLPPPHTCGGHRMAEATSARLHGWDGLCWQPAALGTATPPHL